MAHFAQIGETIEYSRHEIGQFYGWNKEDNIVIQVIVVANEDTSNSNGVEVEEIGVAFCKNLFGAETNWKQTSYNNNFRKRYARIGYSYDAKLDAFISPSPFPSWILVEETADWESPFGPAPELTQERINFGDYYEWDEDKYKLYDTTGWVLKSRNFPST